MFDQIYVALLVSLSRTKSEVLVLYWRKVECSLWVADNWSQVKEVRDPGILFRSDARAGDGSTTLSTVLKMLIRFVVVKKELT